jgi:hypothetical protein
VFGDLLAKGKKVEGEQESSSSNTSTATAAAGSSAKPIDAVLESIRADYAEDYFISGKGEMAGKHCCCIARATCSTLQCNAPQQRGTSATALD